MKKPKRFRVDITIEERHKQLLQMSDDEIDCSDIPEIDPTILRKAVIEKLKPRSDAAVLKQEIGIWNIWRRNNLFKKIQQDDLFNIYLDIEELLGDFTEKYKNIAKFAEPSPLSRWNFFRMLLLDIYLTTFALLKLLLLKVVSRDTQRQRR